MQVVNPASEQRGERILPGSKERAEIEVESLEELKQTLEEANRRADQKRKSTNRKLVVFSIITVILLLVTKGKNSFSISILKNKPNLIKVLRGIGTFLAIGSIIRVALNSKSITVIEPNGEVSQTAEKYVDPKVEEEKELKRQAVRATIDSLVSSGVITASEVNNRSKAFSKRGSDNTDEVVLKELIEYGNKVR